MKRTHFNKACAFMKQACVHDAGKPPDTYGTFCCCFCLTNCKIDLAKVKWWLQSCNANTCNIFFPFSSTVFQSIHVSPVERGQHKQYDGQADGQTTKRSLCVGLLSQVTPIWTIHKYHVLCLPYTKRTGKGQNVGLYEDEKEASLILYFTTKVWLS